MTLSLDTSRLLHPVRKPIAHTQCSSPNCREPITLYALPEMSSTQVKYYHLNHPDSLIQVHERPCHTCVRDANHHRLFGNWPPGSRLGVRLFNTYRKRRPPSVDECLEALDRLDQQIADGARLTRARTR